MFTHACECASRVPCPARGATVVTVVQHNSARGSGVHTPEDLFGSQEAEQEERPVSVGNHLRVNEVNAPDVTFDAESLPADRTPEKGEEDEEAD